MTLPRIAVSGYFYTFIRLYTDLFIEAYKVVEFSLWILPSTPTRRGLV